MTSFHAQVKNLPQTPGVYLFKDYLGKILYIGKATSLKSRVSQYINGQEEKSRGKRMKRLMEEAAQIDVKETKSVLEALICEANYIKKYQPKYNIELKDDKSFSYFVITYEKFPRIIILRKTDFQKKKYQDVIYTRGTHFGPYTSKEHMITALKILRKIFPFHNRAERNEKGCLAYQIGLCPGPFDDAISHREYKNNIRGVRMMLKGERTRLIATINHEMIASSKEEDFEKAAKKRNQINALEHIRDIALMTKSFDKNNTKTGRVECYDMSHLAGDFAVGAMVVFHDGVPEKQEYRRFKIKHAQTDNDLAMMREVLSRRVAHSEWNMPDAIVLDGGNIHLKMAQELWKALDVSIPLIAIAKGPTRKKADLYISQKFTPSKKITDDVELLIALREEAHRYVIKYHRKYREDKKL